MRNESPTRMRVTPKTLFAAAAILTLFLLAWIAYQLPSSYWEHALRALARPLFEESLNATIALLIGGMLLVVPVQVLRKSWRGRLVLRNLFRYWLGLYLLALFLAFTVPPLVLPALVAPFNIVDNIVVPDAGPFPWTSSIGTTLATAIVLLAARLSISTGDPEHENLDSLAKVRNSLKLLKSDRASNIDVGQVERVTKWMLNHDDRSWQQLAAEARRTGGLHPLVQRIIAREMARVHGQDGNPKTDYAKQLRKLARLAGTQEERQYLIPASLDASKRG